MAVKISTSAGASAVYELEITNAGGKVWFDIFADAGNPIQQTERQVSCKNGWDMVSCAAGSDYFDALWLKMFSSFCGAFEITEMRSTHIYCLGLALAYTTFLVGASTQ